MEQGLEFEKPKWGGKTSFLLLMLWLNCPHRIVWGIPFSTTFPVPEINTSDLFLKLPRKHLNAVISVLQK